MPWISFRVSNASFLYDFLAPFSIFCIRNDFHWAYLDLGVKLQSRLHIWPLYIAKLSILLLIVLGSLVYIFLNVLFWSVWKQCCNNLNGTSLWCSSLISLFLSNEIPGFEPHALICRLNLGQVSNFSNSGYEQLFGEQSSICIRCHFSFFLL
jgi:hypothetical protein